LHCGTDEDNIFDAWVDLYGYIVMVNVPWVMNEDVKPDDLEIMVNYGIHGTSDGMEENETKAVDRILTNYNLVGTKTNLEISAYNMVVNNNAIKHGTLENVYSINFETTLSNYNIEDIQTKQDSVDGDFIEDYNTGKNRPIPKFNFNDDAWTGLEGGYDTHKQKIIRSAYFRKKRQSILNVELKDINLGLQRGTLIGVSIWEDNPGNKQIMIMQESNLKGKDTTEPDEIYDGAVDAELGMIQILKLSDIYYIDAIYFEYTNDMNSIKQTLKLIKKGQMSGYDNTHTSPRFIEPKTNNK
jgi:hypothetical protein